MTVDRCDRCGQPVTEVGYRDDDWLICRVCMDEIEEEQQ